GPAPGEQLAEAVQKAKGRDDHTRDERDRESERAAGDDPAGDVEWEDDREEGIADRIHKPRDPEREDLALDAEDRIGFGTVGVLRCGCRFAHETPPAMS